MSALAEALVAAQRRALVALEKSYVHLGDAEDGPGRDALRNALDTIGCTDKVEQDQLIACLEVIRAMGGDVPTAPTNGGGPKLISDAQRTFIGDLVKRAGVSAPDLAGLTHEQASELISSLKAGTYDPAKWSVPF